MKLCRVLIVFALAVSTLSAQQREEIAVEISQSPPLEGVETVQVSDEFVTATGFAVRYFELGDMTSAYEQLQEANAMLPNHPAIIYNTAVVLVKMGRLAEAEKKINDYLNLYPDGEEVALVKNLKIDLDFHRDFEKKQQADQDYIELFNRAKYTYEQGDWAKALSQFQQAEQLRSQDAAAVYNQALAYEALGEYEKATERLRQYLALNRGISDKTEIDRKIFDLDAEIENTRSSFVCSFCGVRLPIGTQWCHRCWHGPYELSSARLNTLPCGVGASATRASYYSDGRLAKNETIECQIDSENYLEQVRYSKGRQRAIQDARKAEGWTYRGDVITALEQDGEVVVELVQDDYLHHLISRASGDALSFDATKRGDRDWLLDREELVIDGRTYVKHYEYDGAGRIAKETVQYQNDSACGHIIEVAATYVREADRLTRVDFEGGNKGFELEGLPETSWKGSIDWTYDERGRISRESFEMSSYDKIYKERPRGPMRDIVKRMYPVYRPGKTMDILRRADYCGMVGNRLVSNLIDLRPFHSISPNLALQLDSGVVNVTIDYTYPADFELPK